MKATYAKTCTWDVVSSEVGEYVPLTVLVQREGGFGQSENVRAALTYATRCLKLGGKWTSWNDMTDRWVAIGSHILGIFQVLFVF